MKRLLTLVLVVLLALGCMSFANAEEADTSLYITDELTEFTLLMRGDANIIKGEEFWFFNFCEKFLNIKFDAEAIDSSVFKEKLSILMSTHSMPDMIMASATWSGADMMTYGAGEGAFLKLDEYKDYCPKFWAALEEQSWLIPCLTSKDGHMYGFSNIRIENEGQSMGIFTVVNKGWLENLDMEMPTTLDEFYDMLVAFRDEDANGDGDPTNEIPWQASYNSGYPDRMFVMWAFGYNGYRWNEFDSTTHEGYFAPYCPRYKEAIEFMKKCWDEGLIQDTFFTGDNASNTAYGQANTDYTYYGFSVDVGPNELTGNKDYYMDFIAQIPVVVDDSIRRTTWKGLPLDMYTWVINAECAKPEVACEFCDFWYDPYWALCYAYGPEYGTQYDLFGNGWSYDAENQKFSFPSNVDNESNFGHYHNTIMDGANFGYETSTAEKLYNPTYKWNNWVEGTFDYQWNKSLAENNYPYEELDPWDFIVLDEEQQEFYNTYCQPLQKYMLAQEANFISGERDWSEWDEYMKELDEMGGADFNQFCKERVAEYFANAQ